MGTYVRYMMKDLEIDRNKYEFLDDSYKRLFKNESLRDYELRDSVVDRVKYWLNMYAVAYRTTTVNRIESIYPIQTYFKIGMFDEEYMKFLLLSSKDSKAKIISVTEYSIPEIHEMSLTRTRKIRVKRII